MGLCFAAWYPPCLAVCISYRLHIPLINHMSYHIVCFFHTYHLKRLTNYFPNLTIMVFKKHGIFVHHFSRWNRWNPPIFPTSWSTPRRPGKCCCRRLLLGPSKQPAKKWKSGANSDISRSKWSKCREKSGKHHIQRVYSMFDHSFLMGISFLMISCLMCVMVFAMLTLVDIPMSTHM